MLHLPTASGRPVRHGLVPLLPAALMAATVLAACGSAPTPSGPPTSGAPGGSSGGASVPASTTSASTVPGSGSGGSSPAPTAAPSTAADASAALLATIRSSTWSSHANVTGTLSVGAKSYPLGGSFDVSGADVRETRTAKLAGAAAGEWVTWNGTRYARSAAGAWFPQPAVDAANDLRKFLREATVVIDLGPTATPVASEHFRLANALLAPRAFGLTGLKVASPAATIDLYAGPDGAPLQLDAAASWTSTSGGKKQPVKLALSYAFAAATKGSVAAPDPVWTMSTSKLFKYRLGHPAEWTSSLSTKAKFVDQFESAEYLYVAAARDRTHGESLASFASYLKTHPSIVGWKQVKFVSMKSVKIANAPGRVITTRAVEGSVKLYVITYVTMKNGWAYTVNVIDERGHERADGTVGTMVISTFRFP
jgi:hypothetical protein